MEIICCKNGDHISLVSPCHLLTSSHLRNKSKPKQTSEYMWTDCVYVCMCVQRYIITSNIVVIVFQKSFKQMNNIIFLAYIHSAGSRLLLLWAGRLFCWSLCCVVFVTAARCFSPLCHYCCIFPVCWLVIRYCCYSIGDKLTKFYSIVQEEARVL